MQYVGNHHASPGPSSPQPRSYPPPRPSSPPRSWPAQAHENLDGATDAGIAFRPARILAADLPTPLTCSFRCDGAALGPVPLVDLSTAGFSALAPEHLGLTPGSILESLVVFLGDRPIWSGDAVVVRASAARIGCRLTSGVIDVEDLRLRATLENRVAVLEQQRRRLPAEWRAAVADLRQLLEDARDEVQAREYAETNDPLRRRDEEARLFEALRMRWGAAFYDAVTQLHAMSRALDPQDVALGRSYASSMLMPLLSACPLHRRAYEKPLGYAGDYRMMELCFAEDPLGEGLFGRFLFSIAQNYTMARTVVARERVVRAAIQETAEADGSDPVRVLALAAGPAMELRRWLERATVLRRPVELILLDQDRSAHESAHRQLTRILLERNHGMLPVSVRCLHFSARQLVSPRTTEECTVVNETLANTHLVYSTGLYDYLPDPVADRLTRRLYGLLAPNGRMLIGNFEETPNTTWVLDYLLDWPILYRDEAAMRQLAIGLDPRPRRVGITRDATGRCLFLDLESGA